MPELIKSKLTIIITIIQYVIFFVQNDCNICEYSLILLLLNSFKDSDYPLKARGVLYFFV